MQILTIATKNEGYLDQLVQTAQQFDYDIKVLGWGMPWKGLAWKLELYITELEKIDSNEPVICADGYDVIAIAPSSEMKVKFLQMNSPVIFSGQRYFPKQKWLQYLADRLMSNSRKKAFGSSDEPIDYSRPCTGLFVGYAGNLLTLFRELINLEERKKIGNDQILLNIYYLQNPAAITIDMHCGLFQNLWRTQKGLFGKFAVDDQKSEIELVRKGNELRIRNKYFHTEPCFLHAPFNLDIGELLEQLNLDSNKINPDRGWSYTKYSLLYYVKRGIRFFWKEIVISVLLLLVIIFLSVYRRGR